MYLLRQDTLFEILSIVELDIYLIIVNLVPRHKSFIDIYVDAVDTVNENSQ